MDAILDLSDPENPKESEWPEAEFIVGNPPFLGGSRIWDELGREYQSKLWQVYSGRIARGSDLCCYWFEKARAQIESRKSKRAGLLATQSIRGGLNREVLKRVKTSGDIFFSVGDRDWILDGASVHVSLVGFDDGTETNKVADGRKVNCVNSNLSWNADITVSAKIRRNLGIAYSGTKKGGLFNVPMAKAIQWLSSPNPNLRPNSDVLRPWRNGVSLTKCDDSQWIIDCGTMMPESRFSQYEGPCSHVIAEVMPQKLTNKRTARKERWWLHSETCPSMRIKLAPLARYCATPRVSKHRIFVWIDHFVLCDDTIFVFAR